VGRPGATGFLLATLEIPVQLRYPLVLPRRFLIVAVCIDKDTPRSFGAPMGVKFFGQYLIEKQVVMAEQVREAIEYQERTNISFQDLAIEMGMVSPAEVARGKKQQEREPLPMEETLVRMGYMTTFQREAVLNRLRSRHVYLGQALVELGHVSHETIEENLTVFEAEQAVFRTDDIRMPPGVPQEAFCRAAADISYKLLTIVAWIKHRPEVPEIVSKFDGREFIVSMTFVGDVSGMYVVSASRPAALSIARALLNQDDVDKLPADAVLDAVKEFANVVCGSVVAKAAALGKKVDIVPPDEYPVEEDRVVHIPEDMVGLYLPLVVAGDSAIDFALFMNH
jgi:CheY-specific phosphatase CheX